jgi:hypothetical protein
VANLKLLKEGIHVVVEIVATTEEAVVAVMTDADQESAEDN